MEDKTLMRSVLAAAYGLESERSLEEAYSEVSYEAVTWREETSSRVACPEEPWSALELDVERVR